MPRPTNSRMTDHQATSESYYSTEEEEFIAAIRKYQDTSGHKFPSWSQVLGVIKELGYKKVTD